MGPDPLVSVVIPSFNSARYIRQTIASVRNQSLTDWELIVVDDCSTDDSPVLVENQICGDNRIRLLKLERNAGRPAVPRNAGVRAARGRYVAFLDADDLWHPQKLELQIGLMRNQGVRLTSTATRWFRNEPEVTEASANAIGDASSIKKITHARLLCKNIIPTSSVVAEREILIRHPFIEDPRYRAIEDYHCWLTIHQHEIESSCKFNAALVYYRLAETSISKSKAAMLRKNYMLYSEYRVDGQPLGARKFFYLGTYACFSLTDRLVRSLS